MNTPVYKLLLVLATLFSFINVVYTSILFTVGSSSEILEDARFNFTQIALKYGRQCEEHDVKTDDGYILKVFRLPGDKTRPVIIMHGLMGSSDHFILRGNTSLAIALSRAGYDVWVGNFRGNRYSRRHVSLIPDHDPSFWDFGPHEHGCSDLPATIDYVLEKTGETTLNLIGYSEGTSASFILLSTKTEYNDKIKVFIALAPVAFINHLPPPFTTLFKYKNAIDRHLRRTHQEELGGYYSTFAEMVALICSIRGLGNPLCMKTLLFPYTGTNPIEYEPEIVPVIFGHSFSGTSRKNLLSLANMATHKSFGRFDYGSARNLREYGTRKPPQYDLSKVTVEMHMFYAKNDKMATLEDVAELKQRLHNKFYEHLMEPAEFTHVDFIWGRNSHQVVAREVLKVLNKYNGSNKTINQN